jgi:hypothetical protein
MGDGEGGGFHNRKEKKRKDRVEYYSLLMMRSVFERETKYTVAGKLMTTAPPNFLPPSHPLFFSPPLYPPLKSQHPCLPPLPSAVVGSS